ncbi:1-aminocyclopropane-1-carboxylate deaminase/D-cysteine desulfhydrase [Portibacter lacus]|nr:pyridoxal-phosphate dependent enzyme [Portibacter lacus]
MSGITKVTIGGRAILVKREDLLHPYVSGNKFRKLKYNILQALDLGASEIISFGGAFSNHIHALSYACKFYNIPLVLFIRGEEIDNPTLRFVKHNGAELIFVDRTSYREIKTTIAFAEYPNAYVIPEGGSNKLALEGIKEMMSEIKETNIHYCVPYGSGATSIGMMAAMQDTDHLHVFSALKMKDFAADFKERSISLDVPIRNVTFHDQYHFGGFAKHRPELIQFINQFEIPLDPLYTGKMMFGIADLIESNYFAPEDKIIAIHTGGLQGIAGFNARFGNLINPQHSQ